MSGSHQGRFDFILNLINFTLKNKTSDNWKLSVIMYIQSEIGHEWLSPREV